MKVLREKRHCDRFMFIVYLTILFAYANIKMFVLSPVDGLLTETRMQSLVCDSVLMIMFPILLTKVLEHFPLYLFNISLYIGISMIILWQIALRFMFFNFIVMSFMSLVLTFLLLHDATEATWKVQMGVQLFYRKFTSVLFLYLTFVLYSNLVQWCLICSHNIIDSRIPQTLIYMMLIFILMSNLFLSSAIFRYLLCNIYMSHVLHGKLNFRCTLFLTIRNTARNLSGIICNVFTFEYKGFADRRRRVIYKYLACTLSYLISNSYMYLHHDQAYVIPIMAMYRQCDCGHESVKRLNRILSKIYEHLPLSTLIFNSKGMCISIAFCFMNMYESRDYSLKTLCLDKDALFRLYRFFAWVNCITLAHDIIDSGWKSLIVLSIVDQAAIERYSCVAYRTLKLWK